MNLKKLQQLSPPKSQRSYNRYVYQVYDNTCPLSGSSFLRKETQIHRLYSGSLLSANNVGYELEKELRLSLFNGMVLDKKLHREFHSLFGTRTTPFMFRQFVEEYSEKNKSYPLQQKMKLKEWVLLLERELVLTNPVLTHLRLDL